MQYLPIKNDTVTAKDTPQVEMSGAKTQSDEVKLTTQADQKDVINDSDIQNNEEEKATVADPEVTTTTDSNVTSKAEAKTTSVAKETTGAQTSDVLSSTSARATTTSAVTDTTKQETAKVATTSESSVATAKVTPTETPESAATKTQTRPTLNETAQKIVEDAKLDKSNLTDAQINALNKIVVDDQSPSGTKMTYKNFEDIANTLVAQDARYAIPYFNASQIKNMPAAYTRDAQTGEYADLDVWDSWPVQDAKTGQIINWNGYQLVVAMMGIPAENDSHLYLLYNKYGDNDFANWKNAGSIFGYNETPLRQEWSGSATVNSDGTLQLYYTLVDTSDNGLYDQKLASAVITLAHDDNNVSIASVDHDHVIFEGDGYHYQTYKQWRETNRGADNIAMRDAHIVQTDDGSRYLVFEASTGFENYQGEAQIFNWKNYGGDATYNTKSFFDVLGNEDIKSRASWANAAIGILKLNDNEKYPEVERVYTPLLTANMVSDEIERPNVVKLGDKYYLFAATRLNRGSNDYAWWNANYSVGDNVVMIGYVSDQLTGGYKPLNGSGVVLTASVPANWRTATYSYYAVPVEGYNDRVLVTAYMTNRGEVAGKGQNATWAPSFLVQINPDGTTKVLAKMTNQGDWIWDDSSENPEMMGTLETAALPGEREKPVDWDLIGYGLKPHMPAKPTEPTNPNVPEVPTTPETPGNPEVPTTPETPSVPEVPTTPETPVVPDKYVVPTEPTSHVAKDTQTELPQLNEEKGGSLAMLAAGMSAVLMGLGLRSTKKRRSN